ncbi:hypothetical protein CMI38_02680 [Candidatus Pacearchaeota archaeon]|nr:hypothetical protein [Candidatus Pacearchaeota archaeon]|tara:strand:- start:10195 stop:11064 length:870 start_codon:yes stop_codon:yes gene_type:complete
MRQENIYLDKKVVELYGLSRIIPDTILREYCAQIVSQTSPKSLCDIGFGKGSTLIPFSEYLDIDVYGIDSSEEMSKAVYGELSRRELKATIITGDAHLLPSFLNPLDLIHTKAVTHIPSNPFNFLSCISESVKNNGYLVIGREDSQPEDNLENIGKYGLNNSEDPILKEFYRTYFQMREEDGKPFIRPDMPAGDYDNAVKYLIEKGFVFETEISTPFWNKEITLNEIIESIRNGTFTVFRQGCTPRDMEQHAELMKNYCLNNEYSLHETRSYPARLKATILKKSGELKQ